MSNIGSPYRTTYDDLAPFFGVEDSGKARLFITLNYKGSKYDEPINTRENPDSIKAEPLWQLMLAKNYNNDQGKPLATDDVTLAQPFVDFIVNVGRHHRNLYTIRGNKNDNTYIMAAETSVANIYKAWAQLTQDARDFYTQNTNFVSDSTKTTYSAGEGLDLNNLRLNLKKREVGDKKSATIFGSSLPFLPNGTRIKMGDSYVTVGKDIGADFLQNLYENEVRGRLEGGYSGVDAYPGIDAWKEDKLDVHRFIRNCLYVQHEVQRGVIKVKGELSDVYDIYNENIYKIDKDGNIVGPTGNVDKVDADLGLEAVPGDIATCILTGDPKELARCLGAVRHSQLYDQARKEVAKMHPKIITKLLKTFAFEMNRDGSPEEFLVWRANLAKRLGAKMGQSKGEATANAILANSKLLEYLKSVVALYRNNPALHGQTAEPLSDLPIKTQNMGASKGLNYFVSPTNINRAEAMSRTLGMMMQQVNLMPQGLNAFNFGIQTPNLMYATRPFGVMSGGGHCDGSLVNEMRQTYNLILKELNSRGKDIVEEDKKRIETALSRIEENNKELCKALNDLKAFHNLVRVDSALTSGLSTVSLSDIEGANRIPNVRSSVSNLESCVNRTSRDQVSLLSALLNQVMHPMALLASGVNASGIRLV